MEVPNPLVVVVLLAADCSIASTSDERMVESDGFSVSSPRREGNIGCAGLSMSSLLLQMIIDPSDSLTIGIILSPDEDRFWWLEEGRKVGGLRRFRFGGSAGGEPEICAGSRSSPSSNSSLSSSSK